MTATPTGSTANHHSLASPELKMEKDVRPFPPETYKSGSAHAQTIRIAAIAVMTVTVSLQPVPSAGAGPELRRRRDPPR